MGTDQVQKHLKIIISKHGLKIVDDAKRLSALMRDYCPNHTREVRLITLVLDEGLVHELLNNHSTSPKLALISRLALVLNHDFYIELSAAKWVLESWWNACITQEANDKTVRAQEVTDHKPDNNTAIMQSTHELLPLTRADHEKEVKKGNIDSMLWMAQSYLQSNGRNRDEIQALHWYNVAEYFGSTEAKSLKTAMKARMSPEKQKTAESMTQKTLLSIQNHLSKRKI